MTNITDKQNEALNIMQEEASEIIQVISKIRRFGPDNFHPEDSERITNIEHLETEIADHEVLVNYLITTGLISEERINEKMRLKVEKLKKYSTLFEV